MTQIPAAPVPAPTPDNSPHRPAGDAEEVYFEGSPLLRGELTKGVVWILIGLVIIAIPILVGIYDHWLPIWLTLSMIAVGLLVFCIPWLATKRYRFRITNYRIDFERGLLGRSIDTLELWHVEDLRYHQSLMGRILGVGNITVLSKHPTTPMLVIPSLPNSQALFKTLEQRVIAVKRQSGVIKVDTGNVGTT